MNPQALRDKNYSWVVVADESKAIFYTREMRRSPMIEAFTLSNSVAREKTGDLLADTGGRSFDSHGQGRHTMAKEKSGPKQHASETFAKEIAEHLAKGQHSGSFREFALVAAPRFLGTLRGALNTGRKLEPYATVDKELVGQDPSVIARHVDSV